MLFRVMVAVAPHDEYQDYENLDGQLFQKVVPLVILVRIRVPPVLWLDLANQQPTLELF